MDDDYNIGDITITLDDTSNDSSVYTLDTTSSDITYSLNDYTADTIDLDNITSISWDLGNKIDPARVEKMCEQYPALDKAWKNFYSIYKMVDQDYKGNFEDDEEIPF